MGQKIDYTSVGTRIRKLRLEKYLSQKQLCKAAGITQGHLSKAENGNVISDDVSARIADALGVKQEELLFGTKKEAEYRKEWEKREALLNRNRSAEEKKKSKEFIERIVHSNANSVEGMDLVRANDILEASQTALDLLKDCGYLYKVTAPEIRMGFHEEGDIMYPKTDYTFKLNLVFSRSGYRWSAEEISRSVDGVELKIEEMDTADIDELENRAYYEEIDGDTVRRHRYRFKQFTNFDDDLMDDYQKENLERCKEADIRERKLFLAKTETDDPKDETDELTLLRRQRRKDGKVDWEGEFQRFKDRIRLGVCGKSLVVDAVDHEIGVYAGDAVLGEKQYDLGYYGTAVIQSKRNEFGDENLRFAIDDLELTELQMKQLLLKLEGHRIEYRIVSDT